MKIINVVPEDPIKLELPNPDEFFIREQGGLTLIYPKPNKQTWTKDERRYRSVIIDSVGEVVSTGFPKFFNYGENPEDTQRFDDDCAIDSEHIWFTEKIDGSLCIRSVINGQLNFRTRGTFDGGEFKDAMWETAKRYPMLLDPSCFSEQSLLFEFVHPDYKIILDYEPDLIFLGGIENGWLRLWHPEMCAAVAEYYDLNMTPWLQVPTTPEKIVAHISAFTDKEGIVARAGFHGDCLVKFKSAEYLLKHRLKFALTFRAIRDIILERDMQKLGDFEDYLKEIGGDWELAQDARPIVISILTTRFVARDTLEEFKMSVAKKLLEFPTRKDFALQYALQLKRAWKSAAFAIADGDLKTAYSILERDLLEQLEI